MNIKKEDFEVYDIHSTNHGGAYKSLGDGNRMYNDEMYQEALLKAKNGDLSIVSESDFQEMFECLRDLMDLQNGCPLPTYQDDYDETIERCEKILSKYEE